jgi:hypothetical protein
MMNVKTRKDSNRFEKDRERILSTQQLPVNQILNSDQHLNYSIPIKSKQTSLLSSSSKQINDTDNPTDTMVVIESPTSSNISELTKASTATYEQSKTSNISSKTSQLPSQKEESYDRTPIESNSLITRSRFENRDTSITNKQQTETSSTSFKNEQKIIASNTYNPLSNQSISVPPKSRTPSDIPKRRSQSGSSSRKPSNISSTISKDQSQQLIDISLPSPTESHLSPLTSKTTTNSFQPENQLNKIPIDSSSISTKQKNFQRPQLNITDSTVTEYNSQPNTHIST